MNSIRTVIKATLLMTGAVLTAATSLSIATAAVEVAATQPPPPPGPHGGPGGEWHMFNKLGLSATQKQQVKDIMTAAHPQMESLHEQMRANEQKLRQTQPTDPNYTSIASQVSQTHGSLSAQLMTQQAEVRSQVYKILTPAQQAQLKTLEAEMAAHKPGDWNGPRGPRPDDAAPPSQ